MFPFFANFLNEVCRSSFFSLSECLGGSLKMNFFFLSLLPLSTALQAGCQTRNVSHILSRALTLPLTYRLNKQPLYFPCNPVQYSCRSELLSVVAHRARMQFDDCATFCPTARMLPRSVQLCTFQSKHLYPYHPHLYLMFGFQTAFPFRMLFVCYGFTTRTWLFYFSKINFLALFKKKLTIDRTVRFIIFNVWWPQTIWNDLLWFQWNLARNFRLLTGFFVFFDFL